MTTLRHIARRTSPRLIGGLLIWGVMETAALRRARTQRRRQRTAVTAEASA